MRLGSRLVLAFARFTCFLAGAHHVSRILSTLSQSCPLATLGVTINTVAPFGLLCFGTQTKWPHMHPFCS